MRTIVALLLLVLVPSAWAGVGLGFRFGDDTAGVSIASSLNQTSSVQLDWRHHEDDHDLLSLGLFANGRRGALSGRIGVKGYAFDIDTIDGGGLALGGDFALPMNEFMTFMLSAYIGPSAATFDDLDGYQEWSAALELTLFDNSALEFGYGDLEFDTQLADDIEFEDGPYVRLKLRF